MDTRRGNNDYRDFATASQIPESRWFVGRISLRFGIPAENSLRAPAVEAGAQPRSPQMIEKIGGRDRDRTGDPLLAKIGRTKNQQVSEMSRQLAQMSKSSVFLHVFGHLPARQLARASLRVGTKLGTVVDRWKT